MKIFLHAGVVLLLLFSHALYAQEKQVEYSIALVGMNMDYKEYAPELVDSESSNTNDIVGYEMRFGFLSPRDENGYNALSFGVMMISGKSDYKGSLLHSGQPYGSYVSTTQNDFIDTDLTLKHFERYNQRWWFIFGLGLGYHAWNRELSSTQKELYEWYSIRPMMGIHLDIDRLNVGLELQYQKGINPTMKSSSPDLDFTLGGVDIYEVSIPLKYRINHEIDLFIKTIFSKQEIQKSNYLPSGSYIYYEPDSTSYQNYVKFGVTFKF